MNHFHLSCTNVFCIRRDQEGMTRSVWSDICHLLSSSFVRFNWLPLSPWNMCPVLHCHNYHNLKLVTQYNLWPEAACCSFWYLQHRYYCQNRNKSNTLLQHVEIVECFVKTKLFDRHFEPAVSPTRVPAPGEWLSSVQSRSKLRKCCGCCRNVPTMQLTLRFAGLLTNKCDFINKRTFRHHNKLTQPDWLDSVKYL